MKIYFVTGNNYKKAEILEYLETSEIKNQFDIELSVVDRSLQEILHPDIDVIVKAKALEAYKYLGVPCLVEHGGIFIDSLSKLPGGIGQIIWNAVGDRICTFLKEDDSRDATARSILGYCDGKRIRTYTGETRGQITKSSRGTYNFNWDPIFIPEGSDKTYGEMGREMKRVTSQAIKAWNNFLNDFKNLPAI
ncbi:MAG TPA: non-canonical purine NTP pyrophosphatase [Chitinophagaceae bacterium]|jgi:XTP/dITP diphosphohydrolase|nr:non-canonical purine NTP pyrophosphatase [Chitinophagaceae bacterium]